MIKIILKNGKEYENDPRYGYNLSDVNEIWECLNIIGKYCLFTKNEKNLNFIGENDDMNAALNSNRDKDAEIVNILKDEVKDIVEINAFLS